MKKMKKKFLRSASGRMFVPPKQLLINSRWGTFWSAQQNLVWGVKYAMVASLTALLSLSLIQVRLTQGSY